MRVYKYLFVFLGSLFMFPLLTNAQCSYERQAELSKIAANVKFSYTYDTSNSEPTFTVYIANITNDIYVEDGYGEVFTKDTNKTYTHGQSIDFYIYSRDNNCYGEKLMNQYITIPNFNVFSTYSECKNHPEFKYCQAWIDAGNEFSKDEFTAELNKYTKITNIQNVSKKTNSLEMFKQFVQNNKITLIISLIAVVVLVIAIYIKKRR